MHSADHHFSRLHLGQAVSSKDKGPVQAGILVLNHTVGLGQLVIHLDQDVPGCFTWGRKAMQAAHLSTLCRFASMVGLVKQPPCCLLANSFI